MSMTPPMKVTYMVMVDDARRAQRFYREALGATVLWAAPDGTWTVLDIGGREVCLHGSHTGGTVDTGLAIEVEDLEQTCSAVEQAGGQVLRPHDWSNSAGERMDPADWLAIVTDTEGNRFCVVKPGGCFLHPSLFRQEASTSV